MIQTIIISELFKLLGLFLIKLILSKVGVLGDTHSRNNNFRKINLRNILGSDSRDVTNNIPQNNRSEEMTALITGMIQLAFTALGCWIIKHTINSMAQNVKSALYDSSHNQTISSNITKYLAPNAALNSYELQIVDDAVMLPSSLSFEFEGIGGLSFIKESLEELAEDFSMSNFLDTTLLQPIAGLLLFGPPGCGKTALAKSFCKKVNVPMISVAPSVLLRKYVGETSQLLKAIFTLAKKLEPCIVFIDEMDSMFRSRGDDDHPVLRNLETEFMQLWDDMVNTKKRIMIIAATNRAEDIDPAVRRRFERAFFIGLPDEMARADVFTKILKDVPKEENFDYYTCALNTAGYSPSDIVAVCKSALAIPLREQRRQIRIQNVLATASNKNHAQVLEQIRNNTSSISSSSSEERAQKHPMRPLTIWDIESALKTFVPASPIRNSNCSPMTSGGSGFSFRPINNNNDNDDDENDEDNNNNDNGIDGYRNNSPGRNNDNNNNVNNNGNNNNNNNNQVADDSQRFWNADDEDDDNDDEDD